MAAVVVETLDQLRALVGKRLGESSWLEITQERIDGFARITGDRQWIHCDPQRAARESPYRTTIAHGFLTLSLCAALIDEIVQLRFARRLINYGTNRVRFPNAVRSGSRIRLVLELTDLHEAPDALDVCYQCTVEIEGETKPACVAAWLLRVYPE